jgi:hypothetical protein
MHNHQVVARRHFVFQASYCPNFDEQTLRHPVLSPIEVLNPLMTYRVELLSDPEHRRLITLVTEHQWPVGLNDNFLLVFDLVDQVVH